VCSHPMVAVRRSTRNASGSGLAAELSEAAAPLHHSLGIRECMVKVAGECGCRGAESKSLPDRINREVTTCMTPEINLASVPSDPKAALGYAELHALRKADKEAFDQGRHISDDAYLIWMMQVRMHLTQEEITAFDKSPKISTSTNFATKSPPLY
jgi:hypothetical protein